MCSNINNIFGGTCSEYGQYDYFDEKRKIAILREIIRFDVDIVSAGYGLISEERLIAPYEVTFSNMSNSEIIDWSRFLNIHNELEELIKGYDLVFYLVG